MKAEIKELAEEKPAQPIRAGGKQQAGNGNGENRRGEAEERGLSKQPRVQMCWRGRGFSVSLDQSVNGIFIPLIFTG